MTAASYTNDLTLIDDAENASVWAESTDAAWDDSTGSPTDETDYYIADVNGGAQCVSINMSKTGVTSLIADYGSGITWTAGDVVFFWQYWAAPNSLDTYANGGQRCIIGTGLADFKSWDTGGSNRFPNPKGGWYNVAVDPSETADDTVGSPGTAHRYFGCAVKTLAGISKGNPFGADVIRYGRGDFIVEYGDLSNGYASFSGMATANDATAAKWGLFEEIPGGYLWKGLMSLGTATNAVDMRVLTGANIAIDDTPKCSSTFNKIEITHASSKVEWTRVRIAALGTQSPGDFEMIDNADVDFDACTFENMGSFIFLSNAVCTNSTFQGCGIITAGDADFSGTSISGYEGTADTSPFIWNVATNPDNDTDGMSFTKGTALTHAIEFGLSSPTTINLSDITFSGYNASNAQSDSTFHVKRTSGTVTINLSGCTGNFSYKTAGAAVVIVVDPVTVRVDAYRADSPTTLVEGARVLLTMGASGTYPYNAPVSIVSSGGTATVTHSGHNMADGDKVKITGVTQKEYNCVATITYISSSSYSYTITGTPTSPATGSPTATMVLLDGLTNSSGYLSESMSLSASQTVTGKVRRGTSTPRFKSSPLAGTVSSTTGFSQTAFLVSDE